MTLPDAYHLLYSFVLITLSTLTFLCLIRAIRGPQITDRIVSINMICTLTSAMILVLAMMLDEGGLVDVALVYAMIGFLAVVVLCKVYMGVALQQREKAQLYHTRKDSDYHA